jgi:hypothetical protein
MLAIDGYVALVYASIDGSRYLPILLPVCGIGAALAQNHAARIIQYPAP